MINIKLVMALEELFKKDPFDLENDTFTIHASRGTIYVTDYESSEYAESYNELLSDNEFYSSMNYELNNDNSYYKRRCKRLEQELEDNDIDFE